MININTLRNFFELLANKYQVGGYVNPAKFNQLVQQATKELQMDLYGNIASYRAGRPLPTIAYAQTQTVVDYLRPFMVTKTMEVTKGNLYGYITLPSDYLHYESAKVLGYENGECGVAGTMNYSPLVILDGDKVAKKLGRKICPPTTEFPIGQVVNNTIRVYPKDVEIIELEYFRLAKNPAWGYTIVSGKPVYNPSTSQDVEFNEELMNLVVSKMLMYLGINLREAELYQMAKSNDLNN